MQEPTDQPGQPPSPRTHDPRTCAPCGVLRHPAQAKAGRDLTRHLAQHPLPLQRGGHS